MYHVMLLTPVFSVFSSSPLGENVGDNFVVSAIFLPEKKRGVFWLYLGG